MMQRSAVQVLFACLVTVLAFESQGTKDLCAQGLTGPTPRTAALLSRSYVVAHMDAEAAAIQVRQVLGPAEARVFIDKVANRVVVKGTLAAHQLAAEMLKTIDRPAVSRSTIPIQENRTVRQLRCYLVMSKDVLQWNQELNRRYSKNAGVRVTPDVQNGQITVVAPVAIHEQLESLLSGPIPTVEKEAPQQDAPKVALAPGPTSPPATVKPAAFEKERKTESNPRPAQTRRPRLSAFPAARTKIVETPKPVEDAPVQASEEPKAEVSAETPLPQVKEPVVEDLESGQRKVNSAYPSFRKPQSSRSTPSPPQPSDGKPAGSKNNFLATIKKELSSGAKSIEGEFSSLHDKITEPLTGFFESVQEDVTVSVTELARKVSGRKARDEKNQASNPRAATVIRSGPRPTITQPKPINSAPPSKPRAATVVRSGPRPAITQPKPINNRPPSKPAAAVKPVPARSETTKPAKVILKPVIRQPEKTSSPIKTPASVPPAPPLPAAEKLQPTTLQEDAPLKSVVEAKTIPLAAAKSPQSVQRPVTSVKTEPAKPASRLVASTYTARPPRPVRVATSTAVQPASASLSLVGASDKEIVQFMDRHLRMQDAGDLEGFEISMTIIDRQVWLILERETGTIVKLRVGEVKVDENGTTLLLEKPNLPRP
jgi:hypothetical protein